MTIDTSSTAGKIAVMQAHERGERIEYFCTITGRWLPALTPQWSWANTGYRIEPRKPREFTVVVQDAVGPVVALEGWDHRQSDYESGYTLVKVREVIE